DAINLQRHSVRADVSKRTRASIPRPERWFVSIRTLPHLGLRFPSLRGKSVVPDTDEAVIVSFDVPGDLTDTFRFTHGQHLTLREQIDGTEERRSYSICAGVDDGELRVGIRKVPGGRFSTWIHGGLKAGRTIDVMAPEGRFFVPLDPHASRHYLGIAGGSGIT